MGDLLALLQQLRWQDLADIALVAFVFYQIILLVRGTRAMQMLTGLGLVMAVWWLSRELDMVATNWLITSFLSSLVVVVIVIFQADIRRALTRMGQRSIFANHAPQADTLRDVATAAGIMARRRTGALMVLERRTGLEDYIEGSVKIEAQVSAELLVSIFQVTGPLHDGAVVIEGGKIRVARCMLPLAKDAEAGRRLGSRHLAAMGLSSESDAVVVVVSEERGQISLALGGKLVGPLEVEQLQQKLGELFPQGDPSQTTIARLWGGLRHLAGGFSKDKDRA